MKNIIPFLIFSITIASCRLTHKSSNEKISGIKLIWKVPVLNNSTGQFVLFSDSLFLYSKGTDILIREPINITNYNQRAINDNVFIIDDDPNHISKKEVIFKNFIYSLNAQRGFRYDSLSASIYNVFNVDSLLEKKAFTKMKLYDETNDSLVFTKEKNRGYFLEAYVPKLKYDDSYCDTTKFIFSRVFKKFPYSLSKEADNSKKAKLIEATLIWNPNSGLKNTARREYNFRIEEVNIKNTSELQSLFQRYRNDLEKKKDRL